MPYTSREQLPEPIQKHLPKRAQDIFLKAFNKAHETYGDEVRAFKIAWAAVKRQYRKNAIGKWVHITK